MAQTTAKRSERLREEKIVTKKFAYQLEIDAEDYIFFASAEKGKVAETFPLLHNYALTYALGFVSSPYYFTTQAPQYQEHFELLNEEGVYVFPAWQKEGMRRLMQYNTTDEEFLSVRGQSVGYPNWGFIKVLGPSSRFTTIVLSAKPLDFPPHIRIGKWMSLCKVTATQLTIEPGTRKTSAMLLNVNDLTKLPNYFTSFYNMLPSWLLKEVEWDEAIKGYVVGEGEQTYFCPESSYFYQT